MIKGIIKGDITNISKYNKDKLTKYLDENNIKYKVNNYGGDISYILDIFKDGKYFISIVMWQGYKYPFSVDKIDYNKKDIPFDFITSFSRHLFIYGVVTKIDKLLKKQKLTNKDIEL